MRTTIFIIFVSLFLSFLKYISYYIQVVVILLNSVRKWLFPSDLSYVLITILLIPFLVCHWIYSLLSTRLVFWVMMHWYPHLSFFVHWDRYIWEYGIYLVLFSPPFSSNWWGFFLMLKWGSLEICFFHL